MLFITGYAENAAIGQGQLEPGMRVMTKPFGLAALKLPGGRRAGRGRWAGLTCAAVAKMFRPAALPPHVTASTPAPRLA
jgi:hypothetical protein